jgi:transitional endoplasmic reticulum ATPase
MSSPLDSLKLALEHSPENVPLLLLYAKSCMEELHLADAREAFLKVVRMEPANAEARLGVASVVHLEGRGSEAAVRAEQLIEEQPQYAPAYLFLSRILAGEGELGRAKTLYTKALELDRTLADLSLEKELAESRSHPGSEPQGPRKAGVTASGDYLEGIDSGDDDDSDDGHPRGGAAFELGLADFEKPKLKFEDVGGMDAVKEEIRM